MTKAEAGVIVRKIVAAMVDDNDLMSTAWYTLDDATRNHLRNTWIKIVLGERP
jgi:hypothetical protein